LTTVAIIGAGPLGRWLALAAARAGYRVLLEDVMPSNLHRAQEALAAQPDPRPFDHSIEFVSSIEDAVREADLAIDCMPDELESKLEILWLLDRMAPPKTVIATPTTRLDIADLAACTYRADRCVALALDPRDFSSLPDEGVMRVKTVEQTAPETANLVTLFWERLGFGVEVTKA
jgi:3-hydroxybutyryl-CoA dehydrogenase